MYVGCCRRARDCVRCGRRVWCTIVGDSIGSRVRLTCPSATRCVVAELGPLRPPLWYPLRCGWSAAPLALRYGRVVSAESKKSDEQCGRDISGGCSSGMKVVDITHAHLQRPHHLRRRHQLGSRRTLRLPVGHAADRLQQPHARRRRAHPALLALGGLAPPLRSDRIHRRLRLTWVVCSHRAAVGMAAATRGRVLRRGVAAVNGVTVRLKFHGHFCVAF